MEICSVFSLVGKKKARFLLPSSKPNSLFMRFHWLVYKQELFKWWALTLLVFTRRQATGSSWTTSPCLCSNAWRRVGAAVEWSTAPLDEWAAPKKKKKKPREAGKQRKATAALWTSAKERNFPLRFSQKIRFYFAYLW